jgi:hypothetical protein
MGDRWSRNGETHFTCIYIGKKSFKIFFFRNSRPISFKLDTNHPCMKGIQVCQIKDQILFKGEIITKIG